MYIYLILIMLIFLIFKFDKGKKALYASFFLIALIAALRKYTVGTDTPNYQIWYENIGNSSWNIFEGRLEPGFKLLNKLLYAITPNFQIVIIFTSVFINFSICRFIEKNCEDYLISTILYIITGMFMLNMNIMRQALALSIMLLGYDFLKEKKYVRYAIIVLLSSTMHQVGIFALILIPLNMLKYDKKTLYIMVCCGIFLFVFDKELFKLLVKIFPKYEGYLESEFAQSNYFGSLLAFLLDLCVVIFLFFAANGFEFKIKINPAKFNDTLINKSTVLYLIYLALVMKMVIFNRLSSYIYIFLIPYISNTLDYIKESNYYAQAFSMKYDGVFSNYNIKKFSFKNDVVSRYSTVAVIAIYFMSFIVINVFRPEWTGCSNYLFFFQ